MGGTISCPLLQQLGNRKLQDSEELGCIIGYMQTRSLEEQPITSTADTLFLFPKQLGTGLSLPVTSHQLSCGLDV